MPIRSYSLHTKSEQFPIAVSILCESSELCTSKLCDGFALAIPQRSVIRNDVFVDLVH
jgi:hypothetical protein